MSPPINPSCTIRWAPALLAVALVGCGIGQPEKTLSLTVTADAPYAVVPRWELVHETPVITAAALNERGTDGWAFARHGVVLRFQGGKWLRDEVASSFIHKLGGEIKQVALSNDGNIGWALGRGIELQLQGGHWVGKRFEAPYSGPRRFFLRLREDGAEGWSCGVASEAVTSEISVKHLVHGIWQVVAQTSLPFGIPDESNMGVSSTGLAWGIGRNPIALNSSFFVFSIVGPLERQIEAPLPAVALRAIALRPDGDEAWLAGDSLIAHYDQKVWNIARYPDLPGPEDVWFDFARHRGWILASPSIVSFHAGRVEKVYKDLSSGASRLVVSGDGSVGFVMGERGIEAQLDQGRWRPFRPRDVLDGQDLGNIRISDDGASGALIASEGAFELAQGGWRALPRPPRSLAIALAADAKSGWATVLGGGIQRYWEGRWTPDDSASRLTRDELPGICVSADGTRGWALGNAGTVLALEDSSTWRAIHLSESGRPVQFKDLRCTEDAQTGLAESFGGHWRLPAGPRVQLPGSLLWLGPRRRLLRTSEGDLILESDA